MKTISSDIVVNSILKKKIEDNLESYYQFKGSFHDIKADKVYKEEVLISVVIPVYNEEKTIKVILEKLPKNNKIEVIVIDDNSNDNSLKEIKKAKFNSQLKIIKHGKNRGYGGALLSGIKKAKGQIIVTMDSDGQHRPEDLSNLISPILNQEADIVIGSRYKGSYNYKLPIQTRLGEACLEKIILILFNRKISNNQSGFRAFNRKALELFENIQNLGYAFATEIILKASLNGFRIKEIPITILKREYGSSKIILHKLFLSIISSLFIYFLKKIKKTFSKRE